MLSPSYSISPKDLWNAIATRDATQLVDVRRRDAYEQSPHLLPGAVWRDAAKAKPTNAVADADKELRARTQAFNAHVAELNSRVAYAQDARDRFSKHCKGRRYYADDFAAARRALPVEVRNAIPPNR